MSSATGQEHSIGIYLKVWTLLFILSACSYLVDFFGAESYFRWSLIIIFMLLKAGFIVGIFMHLSWERLALKYTLLLPPLAILVLIALMYLEGDYTNLSRHTFFER
ncbi:MAG: cytochrome c oxidase subunit 4 [Halioglobus sp.]|jgi:cytochrome c oxidase subunit 4